MAKANVDKNRIIQIAVRIINESGTASLTLKAIADELDIKIPSLYHYVDGLDGLLQEVSLHGLALLHERLVGAAIGVSGDQAVISLCHAYLEFASENPGLYQVINWKNSDERSKALIMKMKDLTDKVLAIGNEEASTHLFRILRCMLHGFSVLEIEDFFGYPVGDSVSLGIRIILQGIHSMSEGVEK